MLGAHRSAALGGRPTQPWRPRPGQLVQSPQREPATTSRASSSRTTTPPSKRARRSCGPVEADDDRPDQRMPSRRCSNSNLAMFFCTGADQSTTCVGGRRAGLLPGLNRIFLASNGRGHRARRPDSQFQRLEVRSGCASLKIFDSDGSRMGLATAFGRAVPPSPRLATARLANFDSSAISRQ